jgi:hypothetical protein
MQDERQKKKKWNKHGARRNEKNAATSEKKDEPR